MTQDPSRAPRSAPDGRRAVIVTGGGSGIGAATSRVFARHGWRVCVLDIDEAAAARAARELVGEGHRAGVVDARSRASVDAAVAATAAEFGRLDAVVPLAGVLRPAVSATVSDDDLHLLLDVHLMGTIRLARAAYEPLRASRGAVVAISSMGAHLGLAGRLGYNAAKAGVEGVVRTLAVEWADDGIRVNAVAPAWVKTPAISALVERGQLDEEPVVQRTPLRRFAEPDEIAEVFEFLASSRASFITGAVVKADGGMSVQFPLPRQRTA